MSRKSSGDAWLEGPNGELVWGPYGAAGILLFHKSGHVLLQHRAPWTSDGDTWGIPGGSRHKRESAKRAALREAQEETGLEPESVTIRGEHKFDLGWWTYVTIIGSVETMFTPVPEKESVSVEWVHVDNFDTKTLHPRFAASWPLLYERIQAEFS